MKKEFLKNKIYCYTDENHRFTTDALIISSLCPTAEKVIDFCAGTGIIGLSLIDDGKAKTVNFCDISPLACELIKQAVEEQNLDAAVAVGDVRKMNFDEKFDLAVFNPPYYKRNSGKEPNDNEISLQKFERDGSLEEFILLSLKLAKRAVFSIVSNRQNEVEKILKMYEISAVTVSEVFHDENSSPFMAVYEICLEKCERKFDKIYLKNNGEDTEFYKSLYRG